MSKKIISLLLTLMLTVSMVTVAAVSVSAEVDEQGRYTPSEGVETYRYYFYMPSDWYNDCAFDAGIYWWLGSDAPSGWPGYGAQNGDAEQIYYCDVPVNSTTIIWNNGFDGGEDSTDPDYSKAIQTVDVASQFYSDGDSDIYDSAWFAEMEASYNADKSDLGSFVDNFFYDEEYDLGFSFNFDNMIYVINPNMISENPLNGKITSGGEWYFYYGNGEYGTYPTKDKAAENGTLYTSDYQPAKDKPATEPVTEETAETTVSADATVVTEATLSTESTEASAPLTPYLTVNATSNYFPKTTAEYNSSTNEVVVTYWMKSDMNVLDLQWYATYDSEILTLSENNTSEAVCPVIGDKAVMNFELKNMIKYNATNLNLFDFSSAETPFAQLTFNVNDLTGKTPATTTVDLTVEVLRVSEMNEQTLRSDPEKEIVLVDNSQVQSNEQTEIAGVKTRTALTQSTFPVEPTETVPVESTTTPVEPTETVPVEPTTTVVEPTETVPVEPTTTVLPTEPLPIESKPDVTEGKRVLLDSISGISVAGYFDSGVELVIKEVQLNVSDVKIAYEISLKKNGQDVQLNGDIDISIPYAESDCQVISVSDDNVIKNISAKYDNGKYNFTVSYLSKFAIIGGSDSKGTSAPTTTTSVSTIDTPASNNGTIQTGDTSLAVIILSILIGATCVMFVLRKREMF